MKNTSVLLYFSLFNDGVYLLDAFMIKSNIFLAKRLFILYRIIFVTFKFLRNMKKDPIKLRLEHELTDH